MSLKMCHLLSFYAGVDFKKLLENALRLETVGVLNILPCTQPISLAQADTRSRKCKTFKYTLTGFRKKLFQN